MLIKKFINKLFTSNVKQNTDYELEYWKKQLAPENVDNYKKRYDDILSLFPEKYWLNANKVADIGCGPLAGIFCKKKYPKMVAVDPIWDKYKIHFSDYIPKDIALVNGTSDDLSDSDFDLIWAINSLDHSGNLEKAMNHLIGSLKIGGRILLHIHMRTKEQLNKGHQMLITESQLKSICEWDWIKIEEKCPIESKPYRTWLGVFVKN